MNVKRKANSNPKSQRSSLASACSKINKMRFFLQTLAAVAAAATTVLAVPMETREVQFPDPNDDPFYRTPDNIGTYTNGQIIQSRAVKTDIGFLNGAASYQLLYRTTNTSMEPEATVATVWIPAKPASPPKIFSFQVHEDSTQLDCAPSYNFLSGYGGPNEIPTSTDTPYYITWALLQGYYVVSPDHEGPNSAFVGGYQEGRATLDGVRALRNFENLPSDSAVGLYGYSGGAHASAWAASLAESYAPDINVVAAAYGGLPASLRDLITPLRTGPFSGLVIAGLSGVALAYPEVDAFLQSQFNDKGREVFKQVRSRGACLAQVAVRYAFTDFYTFFSHSSFEFFKEPLTNKVLATESLLQSQANHVVPVPKFPRYIWHAHEDEIVKFSVAEQYVKEQCAKGANINWNVYPLFGHITVQTLGPIPALYWMGQAMNGQAPQVECGKSFTPIAGVNSPTAEQVLGPDLARKFARLNGTEAPFGLRFGPMTLPAA
ncbi:hypothetical protein EX895_003630 [Sporisorium graminicola]|uniref:triacylglycerol lipase n=1 Tax=Sporisorium graminicola TaxID=280036 RepID=A0A4U7KRI5_9BASI|nr:hypothetical protein EX895_003630 [Sporisorium graminicola]TKY86953.1 hypothetical protein EX895_003630 [Sporisorium graminicola]